jgi:hypothetical protein
MLDAQRKNDFIHGFEPRVFEYLKRAFTYGRLSVLNGLDEHMESDQIFELFVEDMALEEVKSVG